MSPRVICSWTNFFMVLSWSRVKRFKRSLKRRRQIQFTFQKRETSLLMWFALLAKPVMTWYSQVTEFQFYVMIVSLRFANRCFCIAVFFDPTQNPNLVQFTMIAFSISFQQNCWGKLGRVSLLGRVILISSGCTTIVNYDMDRTFSFAVGAKHGNPNPCTEIDCHQFKQRARKSDVWQICSKVSLSVQNISPCYHVRRF